MADDMTHDDQIPYDQHEHQQAGQGKGSWLTLRREPVVRDEGEYCQHCARACQGSQRLLDATGQSGQVEQGHGEHHEKSGIGEADQGCSRGRIDVNMQHEPACYVGAER